MLSKYVEKDKKRRYSFFISEDTRRILKGLILNSDFKSKDLKSNFVYELTKYPKDCSYIRIQNRCVITGRSKGVFKKFKISRIILREWALKGQLVGIKKSSW